MSEGPFSGVGISGGEYLLAEVRWVRLALSRQEEEANEKDKLAGLLAEAG